MMAVVVALFLLLVAIIWMMVVTYRLWKCSGACAFGTIFICSVLGAVSLLAFGCAIAFGTTNGGIAWGLKFAVVVSVATVFAILVTLSAGILISLFVEYRQTTELLARMKPLDWARGGGPSVRRITHERTCAGRKAWPIGAACCIGAGCAFLLYQWPTFSQNPLDVTLAIWLALLGITIIVLSLRCNVKIRKSSFVLLSVILVIIVLVGTAIANRDTLLQMSRLWL